MTRWFWAVVFVVAINLGVRAQDIDLSGVQSAAGNIAMKQALDSEVVEAVSGAPDRAALDYAPSERAGKIAIDRMTEQLAAELPESRAEFRSMFEDGSLQAAYPQLMETMGLDSNNLGDVIVGFYAIAWQIAHDTEVTPKQMLAARDQLLPALVSQGALVNASDMAREDDAAYLALLSVTLLRGYFGHRERGDTQLQAQLQESIFDGLAAQGIDLRDVAMTDTGFRRNE